MLSLEPAAGFGPLRRLPFTPWRGFPEIATFYASDYLLAVSCVNATPESDDYRSVWVGARDPSALAALDSITDESWEYDSRHDQRPAPVRTADAAPAGLGAKLAEAFGA